MAVEPWNPLADALRGENPMVMARTPSGFAVIGDTQHLPGYSVLLCSDESASHLTDLDWEQRKGFLFDVSLLGEAVKAACSDNGVRRINYEVLGNSLSILHGHVHPRYEWEPAERITGPVWRYPKAERNDPAVAYSDARHGELRAAITAELERLLVLAY
jgi:diadenosine tetraphosphate (Ap4A) HIT family hydrolase